MAKLYVCIVSDAAPVAQSLAMGLTVHGHETVVFSSGEELIASDRLSQTCAVVCNMMDGGAKERELAQRMFEHAPNVPLYFIASTIFTRGALLSAPPNVTGIFDSPCSADALFQAIDESCVCDDESGDAGALSDEA